MTQERPTGDEDDYNQRADEERENRSAEADEAGWQRVARAVRRKREMLGLTQRDAATTAGVSLATWNQLENAGGNTYRGLTLAAVNRALRWPPGMVERIHRGDEHVSAEGVTVADFYDDPPVSDDDPTPPGGAAMPLPKPSEDPDLRLAAAGGRLAQMTAAKRRLVLDLIDELAEE